MKKSILAGVAGIAAAFVFVVNAQAVILPPPPSEPTSKADCNNDGWRNYGDTFKNQGDCVSFVVTNGQNEPDGPPNN